MDANLKNSECQLLTSRIGECITCTLRGMVPREFPEPLPWSRNGGGNFVMLCGLFRGVTVDEEQSAALKRRPPMIWSLITEFMAWGI